ncbi:hypothetical protein [Streptomyces sp. NPDC059564]
MPEFAAVGLGQAGSFAVDLVVVELIRRLGRGNGGERPFGPVE